MFPQKYIENKMGITNPEVRDTNNKGPKIM